MPKSKQSRKMRSRRSGFEALSYRGPIHLPAGASDNAITRINLAYSTPIASSAGGIIAGYFSSNGVTTCSDWASVAALHQEYRIVGMELKYQNVSNMTYNTTLKPAIGAAAVYHIAVSSNPASLDEVIQNSDHKLWNSNQPLTLQWKARGTEEMQFTSTASTNPHGGFRFWLEGGSASTTYGYAYITFLVELRCRQ